MHFIIRKSIRYILIFLLSLLGILLTAMFIVSFPILTTNTKEVSTRDRIESFPKSGFPLEKPAQIYWNENLIPFIEAETDTDAAFLLGAINAHLRLGQMELFRMVVQGRLSEMAGPLLRQVDQGLRILDITKNVPDMVKNQDPETAAWVESFVKGINWYREQATEKPAEHRMLNIPEQSWTVEDVYSLARLASADLTWGVYLQALMLSKNSGWEKLWAFFLEKGQRSIPSFNVQQPDQFLAQIFNHVSKSGSNSFVASAEATEKGYALMANDPHLGIFAPNMWFLFGIKSPSFHAVGMQIPGIPFIALGRNPHIAWGGTNMRAISSHLYELSEEELNNSIVREEIIKTRFWFNKTIKVRDSKLGPVFTDAPFLSHIKKPLAITWLGHSGSNELQSFLNASKASNFEEFRQAFKSYQVSGQNLVYADNEGNIGQIAAYTQPVLTEPSKTLEIIKSASNTLNGDIDSYDLPYAYNPSEGYIASANNLPYDTEIPIAYEYSGYNRMMRMNSLAGNDSKIDMEMLMDLQTDVLSYESLELKNSLVGILQKYENQFKNINSDYWESFSSWDGNYHTDSRGPVAFETLMYHFASDLISQEFPEEYQIEFFMGEERWKKWLLQKLNDISVDEMAETFSKAMISGEQSFTKYDNWGEMHRLIFGSPLAPIPVIGKKFRLADVGVSGSSTTLFKSAHSFTPERHTISYGSNSRHLSNMEDLDENYFVLLGGQDGWIKSPQNHDQLDLWLKNEYIRFPLRLESIRKEFRYHVHYLKSE